VQVHEARTAHFAGRRKEGIGKGGETPESSGPTRKSSKTVYIGVPRSDRALKEGALCGRRTSDRAGATLFSEKAECDVKKGERSQVVAVKGVLR